MRFAGDLDRRVNIDIAGRGIGHLYAAARDRQGGPPALAAAELPAAVPRGATVLLMTGSAPRAWVSTAVAERDGPAGVAALARALSLGRAAIPVVVLEQELFAPVGGILIAGGLALVSLEEARRAAQRGGRLSVAVLLPYPAEDDAGRAAVAAGRALLPPRMCWSLPPCPTGPAMPWWQRSRPSRVSPTLLHAPDQEAFLPRRGVELGLINSPQGRVDPHVDAIHLSTHLAVVELPRELTRRAMAACAALGGIFPCVVRNPPYRARRPARPVLGYFPIEQRPALSEH